MSVAQAAMYETAAVLAELAYSIHLAELGLPRDSELNSGAEHLGGNTLEREHLGHPHSGTRRARHWTERHHVPVIGVSRSAHCRNYGGRLVADRRESTRLESADKGFQAVGLNRDEGMSEVVAVLTSLR
jgi:hypothetical protein